MADEPNQPDPNEPNAEPQQPPATGPADPQAGGEQNPDLGESGKRALEAERRNAREAAKERDALAARLKEIEDRDLSDLQKAQRDRDDLAQRLAKAESSALRNRVALAKGLPADIAETLNGSTEDELAAHADRLIAWRGNVPPSAPRPDPGQGPRPTTPQADEDAEYAKYARHLTVPQPK